MRKGLLAITLLAAFSMAAPAAQAHVGSHRFTSPPATPCAVACSYWDAPKAAGFSPCEYPFPEGSYVDIVTEAAPALSSGRTHEILEISISPTVDWDSFICALGTGKPDGSQKELARGANALGENCDSPFGSNQPAPIGCIETATTPVAPGQKYVIRLYNWSDAAPTPGSYTWTQI